MGFVYRDVPFGHADFGKAVPCACVQQNIEGDRLQRFQKYSNLGALTRLTFDSLIPQGRSGDHATQERFSRANKISKAYAQDPQGWLVLNGPPGCGKTHMAAAIANYCLGEGRPAFFVVVPDFLDHLRSSFRPSSDVSYDELFEQVRDAPLLILDDLGTQSSTPWAQEKLFQIMNHRFNDQLPTVITMNIPLEKLDERLHSRLTDPMLSQVCLVEERPTPGLDHFGILGLELPRRMTFDNFDSKRLDLPLEQRQNLETAFRLSLSYAESPDGWLVFLGTNGCGKTHLAAAVANYWEQRGQNPLFIIVPDFLDYLRSSFSPGSDVHYDEVFEKVKSAPRLILDDFGEQAATPWAQTKLYQLANFRYMARLPTVITTCQSPEAIETRISSRMLDPRTSVVFFIDAPDFRTDRIVDRPNLSNHRRRSSKK